jgi:hypothetical protein
MNNRKIVFIVGAGASSEFGLPVGDDLVKKIASSCRFDVDPFGNMSSGGNELTYAILRLRQENGEKYNPAYLSQEAREISQNMGLAPSIDNYLDAHKLKEARVKIGKLAITHAIRDAEKNSKLVRNVDNFYNRVSFASFPNNWLTNLFRILVAEQTLESFKAKLSACTFISFNYDRIIEQFFYHAIKSYFELEANEAADICEAELSVIHPYGTVGTFSFSWEGTGFGELKNSSELVKASESVRTFTEGVENQNIHASIKYAISEADCLAFLGFAFHPLNIKVLAPSDFYNRCRVLGTSYRMSAENLEITSNEINEKFFGDYKSFDFQAIKCSEAITYHSAYLAGRGD